MTILEQCKEDYPCLTREQEVELAKKIEEGDTEARDLLVLSNIRFVKMLANRYKDSGVDYDDLIQEGMIGLMKATEMYDWRKGRTFATYAGWWVKSYIHRYVSANMGTIRVPQNVVDDIDRIRRIKTQIKQTDNRIPSVKEISLITDIPEEKIKEYETTCQVTLSLDEEISEDGVTIMDIIENGDFSVEEQVIQNELPNVIDEMMKVVEEWCDKKKKISFKDAFEVISRHYGLNGRVCESPKKISVELNMTEQEVLKLEKKVLQYIRENPKTKTIFKRYNNVEV